MYFVQKRVVNDTLFDKACVCTSERLCCVSDYYTFVSNASVRERAIRDGRELASCAVK